MPTYPTVYLTVAEADALAPSVLGLLQWGTATTTEKTAALAAATRLIDSGLRYQGSRFDFDQVLEFPRVGYDNGGEGAGAGAVARRGRGGLGLGRRHRRRGRPARRQAGVPYRGRRDPPGPGRQEPALAPPRRAAPGRHVRPDRLDGRGLPQGHRRRRARGRRAARTTCCRATGWSAAGSSKGETDELSWTPHVGASVGSAGGRSPAMRTNATIVRIDRAMGSSEARAVRCLFTGSSLSDQGGRPPNSRGRC